MSRHHSIEISCAGSYGYRLQYVSSEGCGKSAPVTMVHMFNHQCIVSETRILLLVDLRDFFSDLGSGDEKK